MPLVKVHIMQKEQDPLNLRSLPLVSPSTDDWPAIEAALTKRRNRQRVFGSLAAAASIALILGIITILPISGPQTPTPGQLTQTETAGLQQPDAGGDSESGRQPLDSLIALSQQLEIRLHSIRSEVHGMPTSQLVYQVELEDLIAQVDDELSMRPDSPELWSQRVNLLLDLTQLYRNQLRRDYQQMTSL